MSQNNKKDDIIMKINITPTWEEKQLLALKELYNLRESLRDTIILLNEPYVRDMNESIIDIQGNMTDLYNLLTPISRYIEIEM